MPVFSPYTSARACLRTWNDVCTGLAEAGLIPSNLSQRDAEYKTGTAHNETVSLFYPDRFFLSSVEQFAIFISCLGGVQFPSFFCTLDRSITMVLTWTHGLSLRVGYVACISVVCKSHVVLALRGLALSLQHRSIVIERTKYFLGCLFSAHCQDRILWAGKLLLTSALYLQLIRR
jgi:hypothetical protein